MNCPLCGTPNAYQGLFNVSCVNSSCKNYDGTSASSDDELEKIPITIQALPGGVSAPPPSLNSVSSGPSNRIQKQKDVAKKLYEACAYSGCLEDYLIAGGAPRNWEFGMEANDIDLFLIASGPKVAIGALSAELAKRLPGKTVTVSTIPHFKSSKYQGSFDELEGVYDATINGENVQFIFVKSSNWTDLQFFVTETFDFGLNKIWLDGNLQSIWTQAFDYDFKHQTLTANIVKQVQYNRHTTLAQRSQKLLAKFPNFKINLI